MSDKIILLKTLVGSHAHGITGPNSDLDYRAVHVVPTTEILSLGYKAKGTDWIEGDVDNTSYEIGHFLMLATKCNPSILEVMVAPVKISYMTYDGSDLGEELRGLLPYCWEPKQAFNAFTGYSLNQRKKMLDNHLDRWQKYACAYLRTLVNLISLLETRTFDLKVNKDSLLFEQITNIKENRVKIGYIIDAADMYTAVARRRLEDCGHKPDHTKVNEFLLRVRKQFWD